MTGCPWRGGVFRPTPLKAHGDDGGVRGTSRDLGRLIALPVGERHAAPPNNLPLQLSSFVGQEKELAEIRRLLEDARLVTLTGPGGLGEIDAWVSRWGATGT